MDRNFTTELDAGLTIQGKNIKQIRKIQQQSIIEKERDSWKKKDAEKWLEENDFNIEDYYSMPNWHAFRQKDPDQYDDFSVDNNPFDFKEEDGVQVIYGVKEDTDDYEIQSIRFRK